MSLTDVPTGLMGLPTMRAADGGAYAMNGSDVLRGMIDERLQELARVPAAQRGTVAGNTAAFCEGAAHALMKSGLLPDDRHPAELDRLYQELERQGLVERVTVTAEETRTVVAYQPDDGDVGKE